MDVVAHRPVILGVVLAAALVGALHSTEPPDSALLQRVVAKGNGPSRLPRGSAAPDFHLPSVDGKDMSLADLKGASSVLVFVSLSCPYSRKLMTNLLDQGLPDMGNRLVFITRGSEDPTDLSPEVQELDARMAAQFPVLQDTTGTVFDAYQTTGVPTTFMLDAEGKVKESNSGEPKGFQLVQKLAEDVLKRKGS